MGPNDFFQRKTYFVSDSDEEHYDSVFDADLAEQVRKAPPEGKTDLEVAFALTRLAHVELRDYDRNADPRLRDSECYIVLRSLRAVLHRLGIGFNPKFRDFEGFQAYACERWSDFTAGTERQAYINDLFNGVLSRLEELEDRPLGAIRGVDGQLKNIIFASTGHKPRIVVRDMIDNLIEVTEHADKCLVYNRPLSGAGVTWGDMIDWWRSLKSFGDASDADVGRDLYKRLCASLGSDAEGIVLQTYCMYFPVTDAGANFPALLPQVYLHYDPSTRLERRRAGEDDILERERMDYLMLLPGGVRVVVEVDGVQHYANEDEKKADGGKKWTASPRRYSDMVAEDRRLRLTGYEVYRFGGVELTDDEAAARVAVRRFFADLFDRHGITADTGAQAPTAPPAPDGATTGR